MNLKIFTVFHRAIDERLIFSPFTPAEADRYFTLYAVNASPPLKSVTKLNGQTHTAGANPSNDVLEYRLEWHDPAIQSRGFMETSCYVHLLKNNLHEPFDYIGVAQYDMRWTDQAASILRQLAAREPGDNPKTAFGLICGTLMDDTGRFHPLAFAHLRNWDFLIESYNRFFRRTWDARMLVNKPFTLWQTYILPGKQFADLAAWLQVLCGEVYPWANQPPYETHWGVLSGYTERAESLFIAARIHEGAFTLENLLLEHDPQIAAQLSVAREHYGQRPSNL